MSMPNASAGATAPSDDDDAMGAGASGAADGQDDDDDDENDGDVLLTVLKNPDGTYTLIDGDEDDGDGDDTGAGDDMGAGGAGGASAGGGGDEGEPQGETFDSKGALLKAILNLLNEDEDGGNGESEFDQGFAGGSSASPPKPKK